MTAFSSRIIMLSEKEERVTADKLAAKENNDSEALILT